MANVTDQTTFPFFMKKIWKSSWGSSVSVVDDRDPNFGRVEEGIFLSSSAFRPDLGPSQHRVQWVPGGLSPG